MKQLMELKICVTGKKSFQNFDHAMGAFERAKNRGTKLRVYECNLCYQFHVTSQPLYLL